MKRLLMGFRLVIGALLAACGPAATPSPTATPQPMLAARIEDIVGAWKGIGFDGLYQRFNSDGTCEVANTLEEYRATLTSGARSGSTARASC